MNPQHQPLLPPSLTAALPLLLAVAALHALAPARAAGAPGEAPAAAAAADLPTVVARGGSSTAPVVVDGVVEAVRQTVVAAQVAGAVVELAVKAGDRVAAGQLLARIDARSAEQSASASEAQVQAARALQEVAAKEFARQKQLHAQHFISQAALDQAESAFKATQAQAQAQLAAAGAARTQSGLHVVRAPYAGVVAEVPVALGDMAMPGRPLLTLYDPAALRVSAPVPQALAAQLSPGALPRVELPGLPADRQWLQPVRAVLLPTADAATHTVPMRVDLAPGTPGLTPGVFARLWLTLPAAAATPARPGAAAAAPAGNPRVPQAAVVRRAELTALYVLDAQNRPQLRQVRLGRSEGDQVEVLAGLQAGERVVTEPQRAARALSPR